MRSRLLGLRRGYRLTLALTLTVAWFSIIGAGIAYALAGRI